MSKTINIFFLLILLILVQSLSANPPETIWSISAFGENDYFYQPSDIEVDLKRSLIYIADSGNHRILVFDFKGKFVKAIGNEGQGPGEFIKPTGICVLKESGIAIADYNNRRIQIFSESGDYVRMIIPKSNRVADLMFIDDEIYTIPSFGLSGYSLDMTKGVKHQSLVNILDRDGVYVRGITTEEFPEAQPFLRALKHRVMLTLSKKKKLFLPFFAMNLVHVYNLEGTKLDEFDRSLPFKPMNPEVRQRKTEDGIIQMMATMDFVTKDAQIGPDGHLYLLTYVQSYHQQTKDIKNQEELPSLAMRLDIIDTTSYKVLSQIECDPGTMVFALMGEDRLVYIYEDNEGELLLKCIKY